MAERINKYLASAGLGSRRKVEGLIRAGAVRINNHPAELSSQVEDGDSVTVEGKIVSPKKQVYILLNKPKGYVTTLEDPYAPQKVTDLLPSKYKGVFPVGRLDKDTTGLLIMTNDGDLAYKLTHPKFGKEKEYLVLADPKPAKNQLKELQEGVTLEDGPTKPAKIKVINNLISITITEGRKRQVRRMFEAIGSKVVELKRTRIDNIALEGLKEGQFRLLNKEEVESLKK